MRPTLNLIGILTCCPEKLIRDAIKLDVLWKLSYLPWGFLGRQNLSHLVIIVKGGYDHSVVTLAGLRDVVGFGSWGWSSDGDILLPVVVFL